MKLYESLPYTVETKKKRYRIDPDFRNVLRMCDVLDNDLLLPSARYYLALKCIMKHPPRKTLEQIALVQAATKMLFPNKDKPVNGKPLTSFSQDADLIRCAFRQSYGINLHTEKLHWLEFSELLNGLPEGSRYAEVLGIRSRPMPKPTKYNAEQRASLTRAKQMFALHAENEKDQERQYESDVKNIALGLIAFAAKGSEQ